MLSRCWGGSLSNLSNGLMRICLQAADVRTCGACFCGLPARPAVMPDVKPPPPHDYLSISSAGSPGGCISSPSVVTAMEPCIADIPLSPDPLSFPPHRPSVPHYAGLSGTSFPLLARCNSSTLLTNLGMRYCPSSRQIPVGMELGEGFVPSSLIHTGNTGNRPYRSMENLNWAHMSDSGVCTINRSVDSEFILRYTTSSHWCGGVPDGAVVGAQSPENLMYYPQTGLPRKDLPLFPQLLFPSGIDQWEVRKGLREKLRLQSARSSAEPLKTLPLRAQLSPVEPEAVHHMTTPGPGPRPPGTPHITSPEDIKQEVLRRLQLRRQNSSPNLALHGSPSRPTAVRASYTTDNIAENPSDSAPPHRRAPLGRLHIPTFEEFKRMRQKETTAGSVGSEADSETPSPLLQSSENGSEKGETGGKTEFHQLPGAPAGPPDSSTSSSSSVSSPIRTGPSPRPPLQPLASSTQEKPPPARGDDGTGGRRRRSSLEPAGSVPFPPSKENWERPSSCCPALLLEGTDLSSYGAKIYKMKDGLIGSALDLIKKRWVWERVHVGACTRVPSNSPSPVFPNHLCVLWNCVHSVGVISGSAAVNYV